MQQVDKWFFPATVILKMILVQQNVKNQVCIFIRRLVVLWHGYVTVVFFQQIQYLCHNNLISIWQILIKFYYNDSQHRIKVQIDFLNSIHFKTEGIKVPKRCFISCMYIVLFRQILMIFLVYIMYGKPK